MERNKLRILFLLIFLIVSCSQFNLSEAKNASEEFIRRLNHDDWNALWEGASLSFRKNVSYYKMLKLKKWVQKELGPILNYKPIYFYSGSKIGFKNNQFITSRYSVEFEKGVGEIEIRLIKEGGQYKILLLEFIKKPPF